jgi:D-3-phosphoglycerate dehydrogenase
MGFGSIGQEMAIRGAAFGMTTVVWSRRFGRAGGLEMAELRPGSAIRVMPSPEAVAEVSDVLSVHLALTPETRDFVGAAILDRLRPGSIFINTARAEIVDHAALAEAVRQRGIRVGLDVFPDEPAAGAAAFAPPLAALSGVYGTHHIGASTEQAQDAIAAEAVRVIRVFAETGHVPNVVNLATRTPATHRLVVRHRDRPGVLAHVFGKLRAWNLNVQETENVIFEGANAAVASINLDAAPSSELVQAIEQGSDDILSVQVVKI